MSARDELARIIMSPESFDGGPVSCGPNPVYAARTADAIRAVGYAKPRTIRTYQERAELRPGTICMDLAGNAWKRGTGSWVGTGDSGPLYDEENLTLTVLYEPEAIR